MIRTLIAENEKIPLEGLTAIFRDYGFDVVFAAADGKAAYDYISAHAEETDLVVTDIKMPFLSGIELMLKCREELKKPPKFVFITAYEHFDYAKIALNAGAIAFLSKMTLFDDLEKNIAGIKAAVYEQTRPDFNTLKARILECYHHERDAADLESEYAERNFICAGIGYPPEAEDALRDAFRLHPLSFPHAVFRPYSDMALIVCEEESAGECRKRLASLFSDKRFTVTFSEAQSGLSGAYNVFFDRIKTLTKLKISHKTAFDAPLRSEPGEKFKNYEVQLLNILDSRKGRLEDAGSEWFEALGERDADIKNLQSHTVYMLSLLLWKFEILHPDSPLKDEIKGELSQIGKLYDVEKLKNVFLHYLSEIDAQKNETFSEMKIKDYVFGIREYVKDNIYEKITLQSAAQYCYVSPSYFAYLFKKYFKTSFIQYVNSLKMAEANRLLLAGKSVKAVAEQLHYSDIKNFTRMYKKYYDTTPGKTKSHETVFDEK